MSARTKAKRRGELVFTNEMAERATAEELLRADVDIALDNIEGIVSECRAALDRACAMHVYAAAFDDALCRAEEDLDAEFNSAMAEAAGALKCLLSYLEPLRVKGRRPA